MKKENGKSLVFETPPIVIQRRKKAAQKPPVKTKKGVWLQYLEPLKRFPGRWVKVRRMGTTASAYMTATMLRNGDALMPKGRYEYATHGTWLYARYLG